MSVAWNCIRTARDHNLIVRPGFSARLLAGVICVSAKGAYQGFEPWSNQRVLAPTAPVRSNQARPGFLVDHAGYLFGMAEWRKSSGNVMRIKNAERNHETWLDAHREALDATGNAALRATITCVEEVDNDAVLRQRILDIIERDVYRAPKDIKRGEVIGFRVGETLLTEEPDLITYWQRLHAEGIYPAAALSEESYRCLVCGVRGPVVLVQTQHAIPGCGNKQAMVQTNIESASSNGRKQGANTPMCRQCSDLMAAGFNATFGARHRIKITSNITAGVYANGQLRDVVERGLEGTVDALRDTLWEVTHRVPTARVETEHIHTTFIGGKQGRPYVLGTYTCSAREYITRRQEHYAGLMLPQFVEHLAVTQAAKPLASITLVAHAFPHAKLDSTLIQKNTMEMERSILTGGQYPMAVYQQAVRQCGLPGSSRSSLPIDPYLLALIRACLIRRGVIITNNGNNNKESTMSHTDNVAYKAGRALQYMRRVYFAANGRAIPEGRFLPGVLNTPRIVWPQVIACARNAYQKLDHPSESAFLRHFGAVGPLPRRFTMDERGLFTLGRADYDHEANERNRARKEAEAAATASATATPTVVAAG